MWVRSPGRLERFRRRLRALPGPGKAYDRTLDGRLLVQHVDNLDI